MHRYTRRQISRQAVLVAGGIALILSEGAVHAGNFFAGTTLGEVDIGDYELQSVSSDLDDTDFGYRLFAG